MLCIYIDQPAGIAIEDCEKVTRQLQHVLTVENIDYERLEVSSPGLDRPLKRLADYERFAGRDATLKLKLPINGQRRFEGRLMGIEDGRIVLEVDGLKRTLVCEDIVRVRSVTDE